MRIVYLSQYFPPEPGAPAARVSELSTRWAKAGHEVVVVTGFPNHPTGNVPPEYRPTLFRRESYDGVRVVRTAIYATPNAGVIRRGLGFASFAASSVLMGPLVSDVRAADVVIATSPQFLCAASGWALSRILRAPFVLEVRDLWPQSIVDLGVMSGRHPVIRGLRQLERFVYREADLLVSVTDAFVRTWEAQGVDTGKAVVIKNGVDLGRFTPAPRDQALRDELGIGDAFVVAYIGTHGLAHALHRLLDTAQTLSSARDIHFVFVGAGATRRGLEERARADGLTNVTFVPAQPRERIPRFIAAADLLAVTLRDLPLFEQVIPSKIFEFMASARPVLLAVRGEAAEIVSRSGAGWVVPPEDVGAMAEVILRARDDRAETTARGEAGRRFVTEHFNRDHLAGAYLDALQRAHRGSA